MRLTEMISFLEKSPTVDEEVLYTHVDIKELKEKFWGDKEFGKFVRKHRKEVKNGK